MNTEQLVETSQVLDSTKLQRQENSADNHSSTKIHIAKVVGFSDGRPLLSIFGHAIPQRAVAQTVKLDSSDLGALVAVALDNNEFNRPIVIGEMDSNVLASEPYKQANSKIEIDADEELILKCGKTTIKMTADGTISLRGANVISRASKTNRIRGGNVQIN